MPKQGNVIIHIHKGIPMKTVHSRNRTYVSPTATREAGFRPGQKVAVEHAGTNTVAIRPFNKVRKTDRIASYTVEPTGTIHMSSNKIGRRNTRSMPVATSTRSTVNLSF
jgi:hypothetical protein